MISEFIAFFRSFPRQRESSFLLQSLTSGFPRSRGRAGLRRLAFTALCGLVFVFAVGVASAQPAQQSGGPPRQHVVIGFVDIAGDSRYEPIKAYERLILKTREHPFAGAQVGVDEAQVLSRVLDI